MELTSIHPAARTLRKYIDKCAVKSGIRSSDKPTTILGKSTCIDIILDGIKKDLDYVTFTIPEGITPAYDNIIKNVTELPKLNIRNSFDYLTFQVDISRHIYWIKKYSFEREINFENALDKFREEAYLHWDLSDSDIPNKYSELYGLKKIEADIWKIKVPEQPSGFENYQQELLQLPQLEDYQKQFFQRSRNLGKSYAYENQIRLEIKLEMLEGSKLRKAEEGKLFIKDGDEFETKERPNKAPKAEDPRERAIDL